MPMRIQILKRQRNSHCFNRINDKALGMKFLESAARGDRGARPEIKALIYQNLSLVCLSQKQYTNAIGYSKEALNLIKPLVNNRAIF